MGRISAEEQTHFKEQNNVNLSKSKILREVNGLLGLFCVAFKKKYISSIDVLSLPGFWTSFFILLILVQANSS